jgi:hypothetical protein
MNKRNRVNEAESLDKRTTGYKRRQLSMTKGTHLVVAPPTRPLIPLLFRYIATHNIYEV